MYTQTNRRTDWQTSRQTYRQARTQSDKTLR
jgi:hypothetical protein